VTYAFSFSGFYGSSFATKLLMGGQRLAGLHPRYRGPDQPRGTRVAFPIKAGRGRSRSARRASRQACRDDAGRGRSERYDLVVLAIAGGPVRVKGVRGLMAARRPLTPTRLAIMNCRAAVPEAPPRLRVAPLEELLRHPRVWEASIRP